MDKGIEIKNIYNAFKARFSAILARRRRLLEDYRAELEKEKIKEIKESFNK